MSQRFIQFQIQRKQTLILISLTFLIILQLMIHNFKPLPKLRPRAMERISTAFNSQGMGLLNGREDKKNHLVISNQATHYRLKYGKQFRQFLEARDQVMEHSFHFELPLKMQDLSKNSEQLDELFYLEIKNKVKQFLAESVSNVVSASFNFLCKQQLQEKEAMEFASKNIMLNVHSIFREAMQSLEKSKIFKDSSKLVNVRNKLIFDVEEMLENILINLADSYPQAPPAGATPRMRQIVTEVYRIDDQRNDFIYANGLTIKDYLINGEPRSDENYTQFIMTVINKIITVTQDASEDARDRTIYEKFTQFNEHMFWIAQQKSYHEILNQSERYAKGCKTNRMPELIRQGVGNHFEQILSNQNQQLKVIQQKIVTFTQELQKQNESLTSQLPEQLKFQDQNVKAISKLWRSNEEQHEAMKKDKNYAIGQKVSPSVKTFSRQQIADRHFTAKHSSILRILTKWAGYLQDIFKNAQQHVKQRLYAFKTIDDEFCSLPDDAFGSQMLVWRLGQEYKQVKDKFDCLLKTSYEFIGKILGNCQDSIISSVSRYTETRQTASKINLALTSLMLNYTNILIHHLLKAGRNIWTSDNKFDHIDLVVFRVSDLMRSKLQCNERSFISLLKTMYMLDSSEKMQGKFRLVRIKNKLDEPANNIMINYLFMGKVQCQLQLSIQEPKGKAKNYYTFSHFIYELTRGKFGSVAECTIMISQLDPMIAACKSSYYHEKEVKLLLPKSDEKGDTFEQSQKITIEKSQKKNDWENLKVSQKPTTISPTFFECVDCGRLITNQNLGTFVNKQFESRCYQCLVKKQKPVHYLKEEFRTAFENIDAHRIESYEVMADLKTQKYLVQLTSSGKIRLSIAIYLPNWFATITVKIDSNTIQSISSDTVDYNSLDYKDITKKLKKSKNTLKALTYLFDDIESLPEDVLKMAGIQKRFLKLYINKFVRELRIFSLEKRMVQNLKHKVEIIKASRQEWNTLNRVCEALVQNDSSKINYGQEQATALRYNKYKQIDISNIRKIIVRKQEIQQLPRWLNKATGLKLLDLSGNKLKTINSHFIPPYVTSLILNHNSITSTNLSNMLYLKVLNLNRNQLTKIDLSACQSLKSLKLNNNFLEQINLEENSNLVEVDLEMNKLTEFTVGSKSKLEIINIRNNQIVNLTLQDNNTVKKLIMINNKVSDIKELPLTLEILWVDKEAVTRYDFNKYMKLKQLRVFGEQIKRKDVHGLAKSIKFYSMVKNK